ncbi:MAG TPA: HEAT repeat domain-containing protein [Phycisphaerae bacterium]|nr:HEAT repeat domain-containing protein [Phycisphaerae bacterium]
MHGNAIDVLVNGLGSEDRIVQSESARLLGELGLPRAVDPLIEYVQRSRFHAKGTGFWALAQIGEARAVPAIRPMVNAPNCYDDWYWYGCKSVRAAAAVSLLALADDGGAAYLTELADKGDDTFYAWFGPTILHLPDNPPAAGFRARITTDSLVNVGERSARLTNPGTLAMVAEALGLVADDAACEKLRELTGARSRYVRGQAAVSLLAAAPTEDNTGIVAALAASDATDFVRIKAAYAVAKAGRREYAAAIDTAARSAEDTFDAATAVEALGLLGGTDHEATICACLGHAEPYVRRCAIEAIDRIDCTDATGAVAGGRKDPDVLVRLQAARFFAAGEGVAQT